MSRPITSLRFPGESSWEVWRCNRAGKWEHITAADNSEKTAVHCIQALCIDSSPFWQASADAGGEGDPADVAVLRWEAAGVSNEEGSQQSTLWPVVKQPHRTLIASMAVASEMTEDDSLALAAEAYEVSARLLPLPQDGVAIWRELGRCVIAFTREGALLHLTLLSAPKLDAEAVAELRDVMLALDAQEFLGRLSSVKVWTECEESFLSEIARVLGTDDIVSELRPAPAQPACAATALVPLEVARQRGEHCRRMRLVQIGTALAAVFVVVFAGWAAFLFSREQKLEAGESELQAFGPEVAAVQEARDAWLALEPAVNPDFYPTEVYHQVLGIIPERGLRLNMFKLEDSSLTLEGEASDNPTYYDFRDKLMSNPALSRYEWSDKPPTPLDGSRVNFKADGLLKTGGASEGQ